MKAHRKYRRKNMPQIGIALSGVVRESPVNEQGVRVITGFAVLSVSLVPAEQAVHPSWRIVEVDGKSVKYE